MPLSACLSLCVCVCVSVVCAYACLCLWGCTGVSVCVFMCSHVCAMRVCVCANRAGTVCIHYALSERVGQGETDHLLIRKQTDEFIDCIKP